MIKAIIFDYGGVLGSDSHEWDTTFKEIKRLTGLQSEELQGLFKDYWPLLKTGKEKLINFFAEVSKISKKKTTAKKLEKSYLQNVAGLKTIINYTASLKSKGYTLYILANESKEGMETKIRKFGLKKIFTKIYCSANIGIGKPDPRIFKYVLKDAKIKPSETIFIDNQFPNIEVAKKLGIKTIHYENLPQLKITLSKTI